MARIRTIKSEFWTDGTIVRLTPFARLLYIGSWNFACDRGHLPDDAWALKLKVLPADPVDPDALLDELVEAGRIERIELPDGRRFLTIPRFGDHQKLETRWNSRCPACAQLNPPEPAKPRRTSPKLDRVSPDSPDLAPGGEGRGRERKGGEGESAATASSPPPRKCPRHIDDPTSPSCGACRDARLARADWDAEQERLAAAAAADRSKRDREYNQAAEDAAWYEAHTHEWDGNGRCPDPKCLAWRADVEGPAAA